MYLLSYINNILASHKSSKLKSQIYILSVRNQRVFLIWRSLVGLADFGYPCLTCSQRLSIFRQELSELTVMRAKLVIYVFILAKFNSFQGHKCLNIRDLIFSYLLV